MMELCGGPAELEPLLVGVVPLYLDPQWDAVIAGLPACDEWGIRGRTPPRARALAAPSATLVPAPSTRAVRRNGGSNAGPSASTSGAVLGSVSRLRPRAGGAQRLNPVSPSRGSGPPPRVTRLQTLVNAASTGDDEEDEVPLIIRRRSRQEGVSLPSSKPPSPQPSIPDGGLPGGSQVVTQPEPPAAPWSISLRCRRYVPLAQALLPLTFSPADLARTSYSQQPAPSPGPGEKGTRGREQRRPSVQAGPSVPVGREPRISSAEPPSPGKPFGIPGSC